MTIAADRERAKSFFDYRNRATALSIGAAIENMRTQAASEGFRAKVTYGDEERNDPCSTVVFLSDPTAQLSSERIAALFRRTVNRRPFLPIPLAQFMCDRLIDEPVEGVTIQIMTDRRRIAQWAQVIELADRIRYSHPVIHEELFSKLLFTPGMAQEVRMGLEIDRLGLGPLGGAVLRWLRPWDRVQRLSRWGLIRVLAYQSGLLARSTGSLILVTLAGTTWEDWVRAGEQVQRLWIKAQEMGLQTHPMPVALYLDQRYREEGMKDFIPSHLHLLQELRHRLARLVPTGTGAMIFRIGRGWPMRGQSVRLPIDRFLDS